MAVQNISQTSIHRWIRRPLKIGFSVLLNEAYVVVGELGYNQSGPTGKIVDVMTDGRLRVGQEHGLQAVVLNRSTDLANAKLKANEEIRIDSNFRVALERLEVQEVKDYFLEEVPQVPWTKIGGLADTIQLIKDTIELPILYPDLFDRFLICASERFSVIWSSRLRENAHWQSHCLQSDAAIEKRNRH